jgi:hypothetical protein
MNSPSAAIRRPLSALLIASSISAALVPIIAVQYSYTTTTLALSVAGFVILLVVAGFVWRVGRQPGQPATLLVRHQASMLGLLLGLLWIVEISINNFIAPPLPARDLIDDSFWGLIALSIFVFALSSAYHLDSIRAGIAAGIWSGLVSGMLACMMALAVIVFGMAFITRDPLNVAEWAARSSASAATTMAAYFAYETFAGAFLHLLVLGIIMGGLLGAAGGLLGRGLANLFRRIHRDKVAS